MVAGALGEKSEESAQGTMTLGSAPLPGRWILRPADVRRLDRGWTRDIFSPCLERLEASLRPWRGL